MRCIQEYIRWRTPLMNLHMLIKRQFDRNGCLIATEKRLKRRNMRFIRDERKATTIHTTLKKRERTNTKNGGRRTTYGDIYMW